MAANSSTIQKDINGALNGDTVLVRNGTYVENINFNRKTIKVPSINGADSSTIEGTTIILSRSIQTRLRPQYSWEM